MSTELRTAVTTGVQQLVEGFQEKPFPYLIPLFPLLRLKNEPYTLLDHFQFEPIFRLDLPRRVFLKCCRQVGKTLNIGGRTVLRSVAFPNYNTLVVCPRFEQVKRVSNLYVRPFIYDSPCKELFIGGDGDETEQSILQRRFLNGSTQFFSFAFLDAERIRSISCQEVWIDEVQDLNMDFIPVIAE